MLDSKIAANHLAVTNHNLANYISTVCRMVLIATGVWRSAYSVKVCGIDQLVMSAEDDVNSSAANACNGLKCRV